MTATGIGPGPDSTVNFDGIPGPTHNYAGLARGNLAAERNASRIAHPRDAALQGLAKMRALVPEYGEPKPTPAAPSSSPAHAVSGATPVSARP